MKIETMGNRHLYFLGTLFFLIFCSCNSKEEVKQFAATESYPADTLLQAFPLKRAMIVTAHDDDMCSMSGTISLLNKQGWEIAVISFSKTPERNEAQVKACRNILDTVMFVDLKSEQFRNDIADGNTPHQAIPKANLNAVFNRPIIETEYVKAINEFKPSIIFTLDNEIGGYGHPEHVLVSQMVLDLANEKRILPQYIYQSVFTDHMENTIMKRHAERLKSWGLPDDGWENAKKVYGVDGMPEPTVQINITSEATRKMDYLRSYNERERKTIGFFIPAFQDYEAEEYFKIFDREFFRVIKI